MAKGESTEETKHYTVSSSTQWEWKRVHGSRSRRLCARGSQSARVARSKPIPASTQGQRSIRRVSEGPRPAWSCAERSHRRSRPSPTRPRLRIAGRHRQGTHRLPGLLGIVERRRPRYSRPNRRQIRIRQAEIISAPGITCLFPKRPSLARLMMNQSLEDCKAVEKGLWTRVKGHCPRHESGKTA